MRWAVPSDLPALRAALEDVRDWALYPLTNLRDFGLNGTDPRAMRFLMGDAGVLPVSVEGMVFPLPGHDPAPLLPGLQGTKLIGLVGQDGDVTRLVQSIGAADAPTYQTGAEPFMALDLDGLVLPDGPGRLARVDATCADTVIQWRKAFRVELIGEVPDVAALRARRDVEGWQASDAARLLVGPDGPLALTAFSARYDDTALIGGVYTPPALRGRGHARRAVGLHLAETRPSGLKRAVLSAGSEAAARAYAALGFRVQGQARMTLFQDPFEVRR